ncbi:MAG: Stp1/IreP family PP2C-type Ser/Thr phosphatase [Bdellovibrionota bacterium]
MAIQCWCQTDVGLRRETNQDSFLIDESLGLYVVADGMGGHRGGEVASKIAVETLQAIVKSELERAGTRKTNPRVLLTKAYEEASHRIYDRSIEPNSNLQGMGTTLVAALVQNGKISVANVGDSRAYLFTRGELWQLTEDHSLINEQIRAGIIAEGDLEKLAPRNVITRSVGFERDVQVDILERDLEPGELVMMCSDGLSGLVTDAKISEFCKTRKPSELVSLLVDEAKKNGGDDNVTVMVLYAQSRSN